MPSPSRTFYTRRQSRAFDSPVIGVLSQHTWLIVANHVLKVVSEVSFSAGGPDGAVMGELNGR